jgi:hypothetical protein
MAKQKSEIAIPLHPGIAAQPPGGRGHPQGAAPLADGGAVPADRVHPFDKPASPQMSSGKNVSVSWSQSGGASMRNRNNDALHGAATTASGCEVGDADKELSFADPNHPNFRGKNCGD